MFIRLSIICGLVSATVGGVALWARLPDRSAPNEGVPDGVSAAADPGNAARAVLDETEADLGTVDDVNECSHVFWVRNEGMAPLELERGRTSCKCMMSVLPEKPIPPGGKAPIRIGAKPSAKRGPFRHTAFVLTNDPARRSLSLRIMGITRTHVGVSPSELDFPVMRHDEPYTATAVVYSQVWKDFEIRSVESSLIDMSWEIEPAPPGSLDELEARSGYQVRVNVPPGRKAGRFQEQLEFQVTPPEGAAGERTAVLSVVGHVPQPVEWFGRDLIERTRMNIAAVSADEGFRRQLTVKISDGHRRLAIRRIETRPSFLRAALDPLQPDSPELGLYRMEIEVPPGSPPGNYQGESKGTICVETDHPLVPALRLDVEFVILPK